MTSEAYDRIGRGYAQARRPDVRIERQIRLALSDTGSVVNVGAGTGSYEPLDRWVVGVEPSRVMIRQRAPTAAPVVQAFAEALPFATGTFAAAMAILSIHHWRDWRAGLREMLRVARERVVLFTWDPSSEGCWLQDYFPQLIEADRRRFPSLRQIQDITGPFRVIGVPVPHDCSDGFFGAYWRRPDAYLESRVRQSISSLAAEDASAGLAKLKTDLASGRWSRQHSSVVQREELDLGYRIVVAESLP